MAHPKEENGPLSFERRSGNPLRSAMLVALLSVFGCKETPPPNSDLQSAEISNPPPICKEMQGHRSPDSSVKLDGIEAAEVVCVVDGDTFDVRLKRNGKIVRTRIWGGDCAESSPNEKCMKNGEEACAAENVRGKQATRVTQGLLSDRQVTLEPPYKKNGNRILMYVRLANGVDLGRKLVSDCLCHEEYSHARKAEYRKAAKACK